MLVEVNNWTRFPHSRSVVIPVNSQDQDIPFRQLSTSFLPYGMGRSMGDSCLNHDNALLFTRGLKRVISFDPVQGRLTAEAGITFDEIIRLALPQGWFLPVTPGTRFVTLGGAVANDVHGKNHHCEATFGHHVIRFQLRRSDGCRLSCSRDENQAWFRATIGGLGLTGLLEWIEVQLKPVLNSWIDCETIRYENVDEFHALSAESTEKFEHVVAWVDSLTTRPLGRGVFMRGNHNRDPQRTERIAPGAAKIKVPFIPPFSLVNQWTLKAFNTAYYWAKPQRKATSVPLGSFFYPLDQIGAFHRMYGPGGMIQWQALIPSKEAAREVLLSALRMGGSFLTVMKVMGNHPPFGLLSFSGPGITIALDFPYSAAVLGALPRLDEIVAAVGGRLYPAKDARMSGSHFRRFYPQWEELRPFIDPRFSSSFWRRVTAS